MRTHTLGERHSSGDTCDEIQQNIKGMPILDAWGAQVRVICNGIGAQAISAGRDGEIGTELSPWALPWAEDPCRPRLGRRARGTAERRRTPSKGFSR